MKKKPLLYMVFLAGLLLLVLWDCRKKAEEEATYPNVSFDEISQITSYSAIARGNVLWDGGATVTDKGFCWGTTMNPTISNNKISIGTGTGSFTCPITGLMSGITYYIGAYATNAKGTAYSNQVSFTTVAFATVMTTIDLNSITSTTATAGGTISSVDGTTITGRGMCWNKTGNPTITDSITTEGTGTGTFISNLTGLTPGQNYYIKAYATNSNGTIYGNQKTLKMVAGVPVLTTFQVSAITPTTASGGGLITSYGGSDISAKGVCWSTSPNPTVADNRTTDTGTDHINSKLTGLHPSTTYFVRAYATNSIGTAYGNQVTFSTIAVMLTTMVVTSITPTTANSGGNITDDGGSTITAKGVCWDTAPNPTIANSKTVDGTGPDTFTSTITGLTELTFYHLRAYATSRDTTSYGNDVYFRTKGSNNAIIFNPNLTYGTVTDWEGNVYKTIKIGNQTWMAENLKSTRYSNGEPITFITYPRVAGSGAYCWFNNDPATYKAISGALYNWYAVSDTRKLAPTGWHVPTNAEWTTLYTFLGGRSAAGASMREVGTTHWIPPNSGATNSSGFTALPDKDGTYARWWTTTYSGWKDTKVFYYLYPSSYDLRDDYDYMSVWFSVRCVQD